ncbi:methanol oxidation system protein MoxJ [Methylocapsa polymorpha]|uniref:Methanol oxidation system protein MoxJ n=1 Tax=Methylocapsa polymorpha TaxID=3080828 RepID=A0ABZ0HX46_9HYPH|nr:methanol oxidation system protein MoxJ [Methylocapsa sp. RX1]
MNNEVKSPRRLFRGAGALLGAGLAAVAVGSAGAQTKIAPQAAEATTTKVSAEPGVLRVCASSANAPFSTSDEQGFEDKIVKAVAKAMSRKTAFVFTNRPAIYLVRDLLNEKACDVVAGLDAGDERVLTTQPYYRSGYAFISRRDKKLDIKSWSDPRIPQLNNIAVEFGSPGETMLKSLGKFEGELNYLYSLVGYKSRRNQYVQVAPDKLVQEVVDGNADLAVAFQPEVARYVKSSSTPLTVTIIPNDSVGSGGKSVPEHFDTAMGVRIGDDRLREELNVAIAKAQPEIKKILAEEAVITLKAGS